MTSILPWQQSNWQIINQARDSDRLAHAWLLTGPKGLGKSLFARQFSQSLLCHRPIDDRQPCLQCDSCQLWQSGSHPDFIYLAPEEVGKTIGIESVRAMSAQASLHRHSHQRRVVLIDPTDALTQPAANSVLKTLEEPTDGTHLLLVTSSIQQVLPTIVSRCQSLRFSTPNEQVSIDWLQSESDAEQDQIRSALALSGGAPLLAGQFLSESNAMPQAQWQKLLTDAVMGRVSPVLAGSKVDEKQAALFLDWWSLWLAQLIKAELTATGESNDKHRQTAQKLTNAQELVRDHLQQRHAQLYLTKLFNQLDRIREVVRWLSKPINQRLAQQRLWIEWHQLGTE